MALIIPPLGELVQDAVERVNLSGRGTSSPEHSGEGFAKWFRLIGLPDMASMLINKTGCANASPYADPRFPLLTNLA